MPWSLIATIGLKLLDFILSRSSKRDRAKTQLLEFVRRHDSSVLNNAKLRKEYEELRNKAFKKD